MSKNPIRIISRKDFLRQAGLTVGGISAGSLLFTELMAVPQSVLERLATSRGEESFVNTICGQCPAGCGLSVRRMDGIPIGINGNPISPVNRGGVCPMAHSSLESLFHPDRVHEPLARTENGVGADWQSTSWDSVMQLVGSRLRNAVEGGAGHRIAMINGSSSSLTAQLCRYFMSQIGSANYFETGLPEASSLPVRMSHGTDYTPIYDFANAQYILNFGSNLVEEGNSPVYFQRMLGDGMTADRDSRLTMDYIDSRLNLTAAKADKWVPIQPGTYGALALGVAYVLIVDRLYDTEFVRRNCSGFQSFEDEHGQAHMGFEAFVKVNYYPEKVAEITGVSAKVIIEFGESFGAKQPALAIAGEAVRSAINGAFAEWAVYCLNALVGNIQQPGGIYFKQPGLQFDLADKAGFDERTTEFKSAVGSTRSDGSIESISGVDQFLKSVAESPAGLIDTLIIIDENPLYQSRQKEIVRQALSKIGQVVVLGSILDETAQLAHVFMPGHSWLENTDLTGTVPDLFFNHVGYQQPVIEPLFDTMATGDVLLALGKQAKGSQDFPWNDNSALVDTQLQVLFESGEGAVISEQMDARWLAQLHERGWQLQQYDDFREFKNLIQENGGWWDPIVSSIPKRELYQSKSGKFEFVSSYLQAQLVELSKGSTGDSDAERLDSVLTVRGISARGDHLLLPHHEALTTGHGEYPVVLTTSWPLTNRFGHGAALPTLLEIVGIQSENYWQSWLEINPLTAQANHLEDHHTALVESAAGHLEVKVRYFEGIRPGVVHLHMGLGHTNYGRYSNGVGVNATDIIENKFESLSGAPALNGTMVKLTPAMKDA